MAFGRRSVNSILNRKYLLAATLVAASCASSEPQPPDPPARDWGPYLQILNGEDQRIGDPEVWTPFLERGDPAVRARVARALGRIRDRRLGPLLLKTLERERSSPVLEEVLFAIGQVADPAALEPLLRIADHEEHRIRARAVEALGKLGDPQATEPLGRRLSDAAAPVRRAALLALVRLRGRRTKRPLTKSEGVDLRVRLVDLLRDGDPGVRWRAAYALANLAIPARRPLLLRALRSKDARARLFALRGLTRLEPHTATRKALLAATGDADVHVAVSALRGLAKLPSREAVGRLIEVSGWSRTLADHHLRSNALAALAAQFATKQAPPPVLAAFTARLDDPSPSVRDAALSGLAQLAPRRALAQVEALLQEKAPLARWTAARAAGKLAASDATHARAWAILVGLSADKHNHVASAALEALGGVKEPKPAHPKHDVRAQVLAALARKDLAVLGTALSLLAKHGTPADRTRAVAVLWESVGAELAEVRAEAVRTVAALGKQEPDKTALLLEGALDDPSPAVRAAASKAIAGLTKKTPTPTPGAGRASSVRLKLGRDALTQAKNPRATLHTTKGKLVIELLREAAPHHVKSFRDLAEKRFFDGLRFHRVIAAFVVQGLDPRGDGWGTGGVFLRDEINPVPYLRGALGMPNAGPDSGGCQVFITHVPTPHLDGKYTVFGRVVEGMDVVDALDLDDRCRRVEVR